MVRKTATFAGLGAAALLASPASAVVVYDETVSGDLTSGTTLGSGTVLGTFSSGINSVIGFTPGTLERDTFTFSIPSGLQLDAVTLAQYDEPNPADLALSTGIDSIGIGSTIVSAADVGTNVQPGGFGDYQAGTYTFTLVEGGELNYQFDFLLGASPTGPDLLYNESISGDLSNSESAPTDLGLLKVGSNVVIASTFGRDNFLVSLPTGAAIESIILNAYSPGAPQSSSFEYAAGTDIFTPDAVTTLEANGVGGDVIFGTPDLTAPQYTFQIVEFGFEADFSIDIVVIPEPASLALLGLGGLCVISLRR